jgi:hypothetical protein
MKWAVISALAVQAHFAASYLVPLDDQASREFGGLLRWVWPWEIGQRGFLGTIAEAGPPGTGLIFALGAAGLSILAILALVGIWVPVGWWRLLAAGGALLTLILMVLFFGATKLLPIALSFLVLWLVWQNSLATATVPA